MSSVDPHHPEEYLSAHINPSSPVERLCIGEAYFLLGDYQKAVDELTRTLKTINEQSVYSSAVTEQLITALCFLGKFKTAKEVIDRFAHLQDPDYLKYRWQPFKSTGVWPARATEDWNEYIVMFWLEGKHQRSDLAEKMCEGLSRLSPDDPKVWFNLGRARADQRKFATAILAFSEHIKLLPNSLDALVSRAWCYKLSGKVKECRKDIEQIRCINPNDSDLPGLIQNLDDR